MKISKYGFKVIFAIFFIIIFFKTSVEGANTNYVLTFNFGSAVNEDDENANFYGSPNNRIAIAEMRISGEQVFCLNPGLSADSARNWIKYNDGNFKNCLEANFSNLSANSQKSVAPNITLEDYIQILFQQILLTGRYSSGNYFSQNEYFATQLLIWRCCKLLNNNPSSLIRMGAFGDTTHGDADIKHIYKTAIDMLEIDNDDEKNNLKTFLDRLVLSIFQTSENLEQGRFSLENINPADFFYYPDNNGYRNSDYQFLVGFNIKSPSPTPPTPTDPKTYSITIKRRYRNSSNNTVPNYPDREDTLNGYTNGTYSWQIPDADLIKNVSSDGGSTSVNNDKLEMTVKDKNLIVTITYQIGRYTLNIHQINEFNKEINNTNLKTGYLDKNISEKCPDIYNGSNQYMYKGAKWNQNGKNNQLGYGNRNINLSRSKDDVTIDAYYCPRYVYTACFLKENEKIKSLVGNIKVNSAKFNISSTIALDDSGPKYVTETNSSGKTSYIKIKYTNKRKTRRIYRYTKCIICNRYK